MAIIEIILIFLSHLICDKISAAIDDGEYPKYRSIPVYQTKWNDYFKRF